MNLYVFWVWEHKEAFENTLFYTYAIVAKYVTKTYKVFEKLFSPNKSLADISVLYACTLHIYYGNQSFQNYISLGHVIFNFLQFTIIFFCFFQMLCELENNLPFNVITVAFPAELKW